MGAAVTATWLDLTDAKVGDTVTPRLLASATTDRQGRYTLRILPDKALQRALAKNGNWLDVDIGVTGSGGNSAESVSGYWNGHSWGRNDRPESLPKRNQVTRLVAPAVGSAAAGVGVGTQSVTPMGTVPCSFIVTGTPTRYTKVVEYHATAAIDGSWTYGRTADSDIDVGLQADGKGGWKVSGSAHVSTSNGSSTGATSAGKLVGYYGTTNMQYTEGYLKPYGTYSGYTTCSGTGYTPWTKSVRATKWLGGASSNGSLTQYDCYDSPQSGHRNTQMAGSFFSTSSARAQKYAGAASFSYIGLGGTSGFSSYVHLSWSWSHGKGGYSCGSNNYPPYAKIVYVN